MEIHQAIKILNSNATFIQKDAIERFELLQGQSANNTSLLTTQLKDIKSHFKRQQLPDGANYSMSAPPTY